MKKFLAAVLSLCIMLGINASAYAEDTLTLTATVPEPTYKIHVPINTFSLEYGNTTYQELGTLSTSDEDLVTSIFIMPQYDGYLVNEEDANDKIELQLYDNLYGEYRLLNNEGKESRSNVRPMVYGHDPETGAEYHQDFKFYALVPDWSNASLGETYKAVITYHVEVTSPLLP